MDFAALPPEINSARMHTGPGSTPMLAAAAAWDHLAFDLHSTADSYGAVISRLASDGWLGPSSGSMAAAFAPYVAWLTSTAGQAEQAANRGRAAAAAYETALAMTVPPPVITANRALLASLVATNFLGQNVPAIADTEALYSQMWEQDVAVMHGYASSSAHAAQLTPFTAPVPTANLEGLTAQAVAIAQTAGSAAQTQAVMATASQTLSALPQALQSLISSTSSPSSVVSLLTLLAPYAGVLAGGVGLVGAAVGTGAGSVGMVDISLGIVGTASQAALMAAGSAAGSTLSATAAAGSATGVLASHSEVATTARAELGKAITVGALSAPPSWAPATHTTPPPALTSAIHLSAEAIPTAMPPAMWSALPMACFGGRPSRASPRFVPTYDNRPHNDERPAQS